MVRLICSELIQICLRFGADFGQIWLNVGSYSVQIWFSSTDTPSFDDTFFPVVGFSVGFTHRPWAWQSHVAIAYVGSVFTHWLHTPATGEDPLAPPTHRPRAWQSQAVLLAQPWPPPHGRPSRWSRET